MEKKRNAKLAKKIIDTYKKCQFCGFDDSAALEAAHIKDFSKGGPDDISNLLCLCSNCHNLFDAGLIGFEDDLSIVNYDSKNRKYLYAKVEIKVGILEQMWIDWKQMWKSTWSKPTSSK